MEDQSKKLTRISRFLSKVLRHDPGYLSLKLEEGGWVSVAKLLRAMKDHPKAPSPDRETLQTVVETNNKQRFEFDTHGIRIRARQGHSVQVELGDEERKPPECLYHGTPTKFVTPIKSGGLLKMSRHAVHLSPDYETATNVGSRRGKPVIIKIKALAMHQDGFKFHLTGNDVWYTDHVPKEYLLWPEDRQYNAIGKGIYPVLDMR